MHFERFTFSLIRDYIRNSALYKIVAALEAVRRPLLDGYRAGKNWVKHCDFMKPEAILELYQAVLKCLHLHQQKNILATDRRHGA